MKRDYTSNGDSCSSSSKAEDSGVDELFAALGYKLKSSDMAEVALKIEQLEEVMCSVRQDQNGAVSELVHYNPSDLSSWLQSMISDLDSSSSPDLFLESSAVNLDLDQFGSDLIAIPGAAVYPSYKKPKTSSYGASVGDFTTTTTNSNSVSILIDAQENGIRLVHTLMACAEAVQQENIELAETLIKNIGCLAIAQAGAMRKVATYFAEALARRIYKLYPDAYDSAFTDLLQMHFYESCPYLKFAHFTANQAILEAFNGKNRVHVIDFSMKQGMQWPALLQALALRPGGPPRFRLTGVGPPSSDETDRLQEVGWKLAQLAETINVEFEFRGFVASSLAGLDFSMFDVREGETVAVNSIFELHPLLARVGGIDKVLHVVTELKPEIVTVVEQEANHNGNVFLDRFNESLHYYSTVFDSLEGGGGGGGGDVAASDEDKVMTEVYLGREIINVVACEGVDRVERHETLGSWRDRFGRVGFEPVQLGSNAYKQASMLLALFAGGDGFRVEENNGCLMLGWHTRALIATSAWKIR